MNNGQNRKREDEFHGRNILIYPAILIVAALPLDIRSGFAFFEKASSVAAKHILGMDAE
jgi:hypothetical protein